MNPKLSVILCFYNSENTIERAVRCILSQDYEDFELILINDGSTDAGGAIAQRLAEQDSRIVYIDKPNSGVSSSRNHGLDIASGEWVIFIDGDDILAPDALGKFAAPTADSTCDLVVSDFYRVQGEVMSLKRGPATGLIPRDTYALFMSRRPCNFYYTSLWNKLFKRSLIEQNGMRFNTKIKFGEDHVFIIDYLRLVDRVMLIDEPLYYYIDNEGSLVHQGLNPVGVVKMKWDTYHPYRHLYHDLGIFEKPYQRPSIYKFIFMPATDNFAKKGSVPVELPIQDAQE